VALEDEFFGCRLGPVVVTAVRLGMNRLTQPLNSSAAASIAHEVVRSQEPTFTLGQEPTSALELTGAFGAAANDGVLCPPRPVLGIVNAGGRRVPVKQSPCHRVLTPYVARTLITLMRGDTHFGTASSYFRGWYGRGGSEVAGKTGTDNDRADTGNSALWFVGSTPRLVAAASLVNPQNPKQTIHGLPGLPGTNVGRDVFGAYASTFWLDAYGPALRHHWRWPSPLSVPGGRSVPRVIGKRLDAATAELHRWGFTVAVFPVRCGSALPAGRVAYQQPPRAAAKAVVTVCLSSGTKPYVYVPAPPPRSYPHPHPHRPRPEPKPHRPPPPGHGHGHGPGRPGH
jgi:membrane peptidoglycan carboxypeptidase